MTLFRMIPRGLLVGLQVGLLGSFLAGLPVRQSFAQPPSAVKAQPPSAAIAQGPSAEAPSLVQVPEINAKSWVVYDYETGKILAEHNSSEKLQPASITKVMTAYLTLKEIKEGRLSWDEKVLVPAQVTRLERAESKMYLYPKDRVSVRDLFRGLVVASANDAALTLAERISGSETAFAKLMTSTAHAIGMKDSNFSTPSGMTDPNNVTTARDLVVLARKLTEEHPVYYEYSKQTTFRYKKFRKRGRPAILSTDPFADGIKNGFTSAAGYCTLASAVRPLSSIRTVSQEPSGSALGASASNASSERRVITVILGAPTKRDRRNGAKRLFDYAYKTLAPTP